MTRLLPMLVVAVLAMLAAAGVSADIPEEEWNKTFGGSNDDEGRVVHQTSDGGYILAGYTRSFGAGGHDVWLLKTDDKGDEQWNKTFGGSSDDRAYSVQQTTDGGFVVVGQTNSYGAGWLDVYLIKTDYSGDKQWSKTLGGLYHDVGYSVKQTSDGGYIIAGYTEFYGAGVRDVWLIKTDASGNEQWNKTFDSVDYDYECGWSVQQTSDGGFIIAAHVYSARDYLIKTDANGNEQWNKTLEGFGHGDAPYSVQQTSDDGFIVAGATWYAGAN